MDVKEYLQNPCGTLSIPYWKAKTLAIPDSMRIIHCSNWNGQYGNFQRFFRIKHDLNDLSPIDYDYDTLSIDYQATQLCEMINESYKHAASDLSLRRLKTIHRTAVCSALCSMAPRPLNYTALKERRRFRRRIRPAPRDSCSAPTRRPPSKNATARASAAKQRRSTTLLRLEKP